jgi:transcriptional regulator with XRE-family HTH domain
MSTANTVWASPRPPNALPAWRTLQVDAPGSSSARSAVSDVAVSTLVGLNLKRLRKQHRWSLEELALHSGVSRAMLGQIEQGKSVPSIKTLWQVAQALAVSVSWFLEPRHEQAVLVLRPQPGQAGPLSTGHGEWRALQQASDGVGDEFLELRLAPSAQLRWPAPLRARRVNVVVSAGVLDVLIDELPHRIQAREALQFEGVQSLAWRNGGGTEVQAFVIVKDVVSRG